MPTKQELERLDLTSLAVECKKVAENPSKYSIAGADQAARLHQEWTSISMSTPLSATEHKESEANKGALKRRMVEFLASIL